MKPYITTININRGGQKADRSEFSIYCPGYVLNMHLYRLIPEVVSGTRYYDDPNPEHYAHKLEVALFCKSDEIIPGKLTYTVTKSEEINEDFRELFLDWFNRLQAISNVELDMILCMRKAEKWFNGWKNNFIIEDVIK